MLPLAFIVTDDVFEPGTLLSQQSGETKNIKKSKGIQKESVYTSSFTHKKAK